LQSPIVFFVENDYDYLLDGRNRLAAMEAVGIPVIDEESELGDILDTIPYHVFEGDPFAFVLSVNIHRRHLKPEKKRDLIRKVLKAQPAKSDRQIAAETKTSPTTVGTVRAKAEAAGDVSKLDTRTDATGRQQPARKPAKKPAPGPRVAPHPWERVPFYEGPPNREDPRPEPRTEDPAPAVTSQPEESAEDRKAQYALLEAAVAEAEAAHVNPVTAAWETASETQRREFVKAFYVTLIQMSAEAA
jgi:hypothetical protein